MNTTQSPNATEILSLSSEDITQLVAYFIIIVCGFVLNSFVILLVWTNKVPRKNINIFVVNMAIADLISLLGLPLSRVTSFLYRANMTRHPLNDDTARNNVLCSLFQFTVFTTLLVSPVTLLIISLERFRAVSASVKLLPLSRVTLCALVAVSWATPIGVVAFLAINSDIDPYYHDYGCFVHLSTSTLKHYFNSIAICLVALVLAIIATNMGTIRRLVLSQTDGVNLLEAQRKRRRKMFRSATRMISSSTFLYAVCVAPRFIVLVLLFHYLKSNASEDFINFLDKAYIITTVTIYVNAAFGPLIYFVFLEDFQEALNKLMRHTNNMARDAHETSNEPEGIELHPMR
ncbi:predicted protein [Nematostella vectensis]|uniref:G-protein coupled receptors family 1 profile domain-containing protein n=1 Tax=Nematostella vectensis TaxID=45351 RepID=A7SR88_NEMVE|nr:predicted protein [Nematostella vectensis]|eukprot:XP_001625868.1 predicted protein [Nematostella vectensis]